MVGPGEVANDALQLMVNGGILYAIPLFCLSLLMVLEGRKRIPITMGLVGFILGFDLVGPLYDWFGGHSMVTKSMFQLAAAILVGGLSVVVGEFAMRVLAAGLVYVIITTLIAAASTNGIDLEGGVFLSGVLTLISFFLSFSFRRIVPALMAGLVGTMGMMVSLYVAFGWPLSRLNGVDAPDAYLALVGMVVSTYFQLNHIKEEREKEVEPEVEKEYIF